jgi:ABC-type phosphate/phosphonate transport system substrate-binding protein
LHQKRTTYPIIALLVAILLSAACGATSPQPTATHQQPTNTPNPPTQTPPREILGTTTGRVLTTIEFGTGLVTINGIAVELDSGGTVEAQLPTGVMDVIAAGIRVRVEPIVHDDFEWRVVEIVAGGVATPDMSVAAATATARCRMVGAVPDDGTMDIFTSLDSLAQLLAEKLGCDIQMTTFQPDVLDIMFLAGEVDFALVNFQDFHRNYGLDSVDALLIPSYVDSTSAYFRGAFFARTVDGPSSLGGAGGLGLGYPYHASSYGYYFPRVMLDREGYDPNAFFSETIALGASPVDVFEALLDGTVDIAITWADEDTDARIVAETQFPDIWSTTQVIATTAWMPNRVIMVQASMPEDRRSALRDALIELSMEDAGRDVLSGIHALAGFELPDERLWTAIELMDLAEQLEDDIGPWP